MYNSILTNTVANVVLRNLNNSNSKILSTTTRLASGLKINQAKDDSAGSVISTKQKVQLSGMDAIKDSTMHAISLLNIAEGALDNMAESVIRIRDLSLYAMNSICSNEELNAIQEEIDELTNEIYRQKQTTMYNGMKLFNMEEIKEVNPNSKPYAYEVEYIESKGTQWIDTGIYPSDNESFEMDFTVENWETTKGFHGVHDAGNTWKSLVYTKTNKTLNIYFGGKELYGFNVSNGTKYSLSVKNNNKNVTTTLNGETKTGSYTRTNASSAYTNALFDVVGYNYQNSSMKLYGYKHYTNGVLDRDYIPVVDKNGVACLYDKVSDSLFYNQGTGEFVAGERIETDDVVVEKKEFSLQVGANAGSDNAINVKLGLDFEGFGGNIFNAKETLSHCDRILDFINSKKAQIGSSMNRIESITKLQENNYVNLSNSKSLTTDADFAFEGTNLANYQILRDISSTLFAQANSMNGALALRLLGI